MQLHTLFDTLKHLTLSRERKARMRAELASYADLHALQDAAPQAKRSPVSILYSRTRRFYAGALAALLIVLGGTQASLAAEEALPGDVLYPIKVAVNEPLALTLSFAPERKAELSAKFAARRLDEAAKLSEHGRLDDRTATELATRFDAHVESVAHETTLLESRGALAASLAVRTDLNSRITEGAGGIARGEAADAALMATSATEDMAAGEFANRVLEKSRKLETTREKLDTALALDLKADSDVRGLVKGKRVSKEAEKLLSATLGVSASATSTASSTDETSGEEELDLPVDEVPLPDLPVQRFFSPFSF